MELQRTAVQKLQWLMMGLWGWHTSALWQKQKLSPVLPSISSLFHTKGCLWAFCFYLLKNVYVRGSPKTESDHSIFQKLLMCDSDVWLQAECSVCFSFHLRHPCPFSKASTLNLNKLHLSSDGTKLVSQWRGVIKHWTSVISALPWNKLKAL